MIDFSSIHIPTSAISLCAFGPSIKRLTDDEKIIAMRNFSIGVNFFDAWPVDVRAFIDVGNPLVRDLSGHPMVPKVVAGPEDIFWDKEAMKITEHNLTVTDILMACRFCHPEKDVVLYGIDLGGDSSIQYGDYPNRANRYKEMLDLERLVFQTLRQAKDVFENGMMTGEDFFSRIYAGPKACDGMPWIQKLHVEEHHAA